MTFAELNAAVADLRTALRSFVGENALGEVTVRPPAGDNDEASFLRLVFWNYALLFEAGRVALPFLLELPARTSEPKRDCRVARQLVNELRTWSSHNLGLTGDRDRELSQRVQRWFISTCGANPPNNDGCWRKCCQALCAEVGAIVAHCQDAVTNVLTAADDGQSAIDDLRRRIERVWPAYKFDELVGDAATRLGLGVRIDVPKFRGTRLGKWRGLLESLAEGDNLEAQVIRLIERDLLDYVADVLPIDGRDVMSALALDPGPAVARVLHRARELYRSGITDRDRLLAKLAEPFEAAEGDAVTETGASGEI
jgi:hypothetical protein